MGQSRRRFVPLENFSDTEGRCQCGCGGAVGDEIMLRLQAFIRTLALVADPPIKCRVNSGFRCAKHNAAVGGAADSRHLHGDAVDVVFFRADGSQIDNADVAVMARKSGLFTGIGYMQYAKQGKNLVHLDCRPGALVIW